MAITESDLDELAQLACLNIEPNERSLLAQEVSAIMDFVEQLRLIDTTEVTPLFHPFDLHQRFKADEITEEDCSAQLGEIAPLFEDDLYLVPKVIDAGE